MLVLALDLSWRPVRLRGWLWRLADCLALAVRAGAAAPRPEAASLARFEALVLPHLDAAYNLARYLTGSADAAGDAVQEAMLRAFRGFAGYRGGEPRAWLLAIVRNCCRAWAGARRGQPGPLPDDEDAPLPEDPADSPETALLRRREAVAVRAAIAALPPVYREVLVLRELEDLSYQQIAAVVEAPMGTVMSRLARARALFRRAWESQPQEALP